MTDFPRTVRERVEAQGFLGLEDGLVYQIDVQKPLSWSKEEKSIFLGL